MDLHGIYVPLVTPFTDGGELAAGALERLAHEVLDEGAAGLVALGTTAEAATLDDAERRTVVELCARVCRERGATLIVGAGSSDTRRSAEALAKLAGADAALVAVPAFSRPGEEGVLAHFAYLAERSPVPLIVYHIPYRTGQTLSAAALRRLGGLPGVAGVKLAVGGVDQAAMELLGDVPPASRCWPVTTCTSRRCWPWGRRGASWRRRTWPPDGSSSWRRPGARGTRSTRAPSATGSRPWPERPSPSPIRP